MSLSFSQHLDLLDRQGRAVVASLEVLSPDTPVPPDGGTVTEVGAEHWATLEIWSWSLTHLDQHWSRREDPVAPADHATLVTGISALVDQVVTVLRATGPDRPVDFFDRPGRTADVARLLAHEAITMAHRTSLAAGRPTPVVLPAVASDGVGQALAHWGSSSPATASAAQPVAIRTTDTGEDWYLSLPDDADTLAGDFQLVPAQAPAAVVQGPAVNVLWWLHGLPEPLVQVTGADAEVRKVKGTFLQPVEAAPRKRRWFR